MPQNQQFDSGELRSLAIGYDVLSTALSPDVRLIDGLNMVVTNKGALNKRYGTVPVSGAINDSTGYIDHMLGYESLETTPKRLIALVNSITSTSSYGVKIIQPATGALGTTSSLRNSNLSKTPQEIAVSRGLLYIRGSGGSASVDTLSTISYNGANNTYSIWGILPPTTPTAVSAGAASTYNFTVNFGWQYVYTWKTINGHESNRSPLQTDPSKTSSNTGAISNTYPSIVVQGNSDTTNVPSICIYRTTDGGGNFYFLEQITNTGAGNITYADRNFNDGLATPAQPYPDSALDTTRVSPTLTSNSPPPSVSYQDTAFTTLTASANNSTTSLTISSTFNSVTFTVNGQVAASVPMNITITIDQEQMTVTTLGSTSATVTRGVNGTVKAAHANGASVRYTPTVGIDGATQCTNMATYAGRLWYGLNNVLYYSGNEEISAGIPEECWPSGLNGNFYRFSSPITHLQATSEALYVVCTEEVHWLRGNTKDSFQVQPIFTDIGGIHNNPRAICAADKSIIFLTNDLRICIARGLKRDFLSDPLADKIKTAIQTDGATIDLTRYAYQEKDFLIVSEAYKGFTPDNSKSRQYVYDFNQTEAGIWNVPWNIPALCFCSAYTDIGGTSATTGRYLLSGNFSTVGIASRVSYVDFTFVSMFDNYPNVSDTTTYACNFTISLVRNPTGNHVNMLREPGMVSILHAIKMDRTAFTSDTDPTLTYFLDNSSGAGGTTAGTPETPPRRVQSTGYTTLWYMIDTACERVSAKFSKTASLERFEVQMIAFIFNPDSGA